MVNDKNINSDKQTSNKAVSERKTNNILATDQAGPRPGKNGNFPPKSRQFGQPNGNPRNPGGWKKEDTPRYKLERMMTMDDDELEEIYKDRKRPTFERNYARFIHNGKFEEYDKMINQVYGQPKATQETVISGELTQNQRPYQGMTKEELRKLLDK